MFIWTRNSYQTFLCLCAFLWTGTPIYATLVRVGPTAKYPSPCSAAADVKSGDTVLIAQGLYLDQACTWDANTILIKGEQAWAHMRAPGVIANQKAIWVIRGTDVVVENVEFSDASVPDKNGAGIRAEGKNLTIRGCWFHNNEDGILGGAGTMLIENSIFDHNGFGDGYSHNLYISDCDSLIFRFNYSHHAKIGHELKSRARVNLILYNRIMNEADGTASYTIDLPNGGTSIIMGNLLQQGPNTSNSAMLDYGSEGLVYPGKDLYLSHNTLVNDRGSGQFLKLASGSTCVSVNNVLLGSGQLGGCPEKGNVYAKPDELINAAGFDYRPVAGASFLNSPVAPGDANGFSLIPQFQYQHPANKIPRINVGLVDAGAYEWNSGAFILKRSTLNLSPPTGNPPLRDLTGRFRHDCGWLVVYNIQQQ